MMNYGPSFDKVKAYVPPPVTTAVPLGFVPVLARPVSAQADDGDQVRATELQTAMDLVKLHGKLMRFDRDAGRWLIWTGRAWEPDTLGQVEKWCKALARDTWHRYEFLDSKEVKTLAKRMETAAGLSGVLRLASTEEGIPVLRKMLDADLWAFNCQNATIDLKTGAARDHRPEDLCSIVAPVVYLADATAPTWLAFLHRIFAGNVELIEYVQKVLGMSLTGDITEQCLYIFHGTGANGKSTLLDTVLKIMGEYAGSAPEGLMVQNLHNDHQTELAGLAGKRFIQASEIKAGAKLRTQLIKKLTGDATINARFMRQDYFEFPRTFKMVLQTNHLPEIDEDSEAIWRRIRAIPFDVTIPTEERDPDLLAKLMAEASGILSWLIEGCIAWQRDGMKPPAAVLVASQEYRNESDHGVADFLAACTIKAGHAKTDRAELHREYLKFCGRAGEQEPLANKAFFDRIRREPGVEDTRWKNSDGIAVRGFSGLGLCLGGQNE